MKRCHSLLTLLAVAAAGCTYVEPGAAPLAGSNRVIDQQPGAATGGGGGLVGNNAARLTASITGTLRGPLASVVANNPGNLLGNNAAGLVGNNAAGLVGNNAAGFRLTALADWTEPAANVEVVLYDARGRALGGAAVHADAEGHYRFDGVETSDPVVFVRARYRLADQELTLSAATAAPRRGENLQVAVDPATTLVGKKVAQLIAAGTLAPAELGEETLSRMVHDIAPLMTEKAVAAAALLGPDQAAAAFDALLKANPAFTLELRRKGDDDPKLGGL
jgi:hypothetical protein